MVTKLAGSSFLDVNMKEKILAIEKNVTTFGKVVSDLSEYDVDGLPNDNMLDDNPDSPVSEKNFARMMVLWELQAAWLTGLVPGSKSMVAIMHKIAVLGKFTSVDSA
ncbi:hypothetical protein G9A89_001155 [Geosiphon pyriformis]|nr:hypothetical protein G9A89_001155 [Geosiphon pyriformis]